MTREERDGLKGLIDKYGLATVLNGIGLVCLDKADQAKGDAVALAWGILAERLENDAAIAKRVLP